jgi:hypothetical protein
MNRSPLPSNAWPAELLSLIDDYVEELADELVPDHRVDTGEWDNVFWRERSYLIEDLTLRAEVLDIFAGAAVL